MTGVIDVVKKSNRGKEPFDAGKLQKSIYAACLSVNLPLGEAGQVAELVVHDVLKWLDNKEVVTGGDIRQIAHEKLLVYHPDVAYIYKQYKHIM